MADKKSVVTALKAMEGVGARARVFVSMPVVDGITPKSFLNARGVEKTRSGEPLTRMHGIFPPDSVGLSFFDHGGLYGDGCFEGILIKNGLVFLYKEHMERLWRSAGSLRIEIPYTIEELSWQVVRAIQATGIKKSETGYIRLIVTRGIGDLGLNPRKCVGSTVYAIVSTIKLYPREAYDMGIEVGVSRKIRRPGNSILDPRIKSDNYLNNVLGLFEGTNNMRLLESIMLTDRGFIAEATVDNIFSVTREYGRGGKSQKVRVVTPVGEYCLEGITRACIMEFAKRFGYDVEEVPDLMPLDLVGPGKECFMTGTGAGIMPIVKVCGNLVGDGKPGPATRKLLAEIERAMADPANGLDVNATRQDVVKHIRQKKARLVK
ncbi:MAG: aminotransferase class IV [Candidatus Eisenbacteria bacterium]|nr:aminotransferase class IV [Candidatus Eisenbacteria bacterium]